MGSPLQEIFQRRGDQKRSTDWITKGLLLLPIIFSWFGLILDFPVHKTGLWFTFSITSVLVSALSHFVLSKRSDYSVEFLFSIALVFSGLISLLKLHWLKLAYFPFIISMTAFYSLSTVIPLSLLIPFLEFRTFFIKENVIEEAAFSVFVILTSVISSFIFNMLRKEKEKLNAELQRIQKDAKEITPEAEMDSLDSNELMSHYLASMLKTEEEISELLYTLKQAIFADTSSLLVPGGSGFIVRCSTEDKNSIIISLKGAVRACIQNKKPFYCGELTEKKIETGYLHRNKISSLILMPLMDGTTLIGLLSVDSSRYQAFSETDRNTVQMFANHLVRILQRERVYLMIKRDVFGLKILKEESAHLAASLDIDIIGRNLCRISEKIASSQSFFFVYKEKGFELVYHTGEFRDTGKIFDFRGTIASFAIENNHRHYVSNTKDYTIQIMPSISSDDIRSAIIIPLSYESKVIGLFVMLSGKDDFLDAFQIELLEVICHQASTSVANAMLHSEIEKLATTDGLTGLFNHRRFQEKLNAEMKRISRYPGSLSLLLIDIDYFKKVNDTYGHPAGDIVLKGVARIIKEMVRDIDIPARYGGEEFAVILPETDSEGAKIIAERVRKKVMETPFMFDDVIIRVTISIGIATSPGDAKTKEELIEKSDQALYHAKHNGRNLSVICNSIT